MSINPNDPMVLMLKQIIQGYQDRLDSMDRGIQEAFMTLAQGNAKVFQEVLGRLSLLEQTVQIDRVIINNSDLMKGLEEKEGKEL